MGKKTRGAFDHLRQLLGVPGRQPRPPVQREIIPSRRAGDSAAAARTSAAVPANGQTTIPEIIPTEKQRKVDELRRELQTRNERMAFSRSSGKRPAKRTRPRFRAMNERERALAQALSRVTFSIGSYAKRFAREIGNEARSEFPLITSNQANYLRTLVHRYRRQINPGALPPEERHLLVDARKRTKAEDQHV